MSIDLRGSTPDKTPDETADRTPDSALDKTPDNGEQPSDPSARLPICEGSSILDLSLAELMDCLRTSSRGLTDRDVEARLEEYGPNELATTHAVSPIVSFLKLLADPLLLVLIISGIVSFFSGEIRGAIIIGAIVLISSILQFVQEYTSEQTARKLARRVAVTSTVMRDGEYVEVPIAQLVPGDSILLGVGDIVPADARVLTAKDFFVDQSTLTGESAPVEKWPYEGSRSPASLPDMDHVVFFGTNIVSGTATAIVAETGGRTQFGRLARKLTEGRPKTEFQKGIERFTKMLVRIVIGLVIFIFLGNLFMRRSALDSLLFSIAVAVGITPELLPMIITINLTAGARAMAQNKVIVKRLQSIQNLGSMDILCTDKTGTLTEGKLDLNAYTDAEGKPSRHVLELAAVNSYFQASLKSPMDAAIGARISPDDLKRYTKVDEIPFDFTRRRVSVVAGTSDGRLLITKGAPESVLEICAHVELGGETRDITPELRRIADDEFTKLSADGYRALAVAYRPIGNDRTIYSVADEADLVFVGFVSFIDPPKATTRQAVQEAKKLGVAIKILTGDNELVTKRICERVGLEVKGVLMGHEVDTLTDDELALRIEESTVCARLSPEQKNRIIMALKNKGHVVGYMGDGINDAPSLRAADVGISVENAVDIAKEAADIILLEAGLDILDTGIIEGRRTFANTLKYIMMGTSSNFGNVFSVPAALFIVPFLPMRPVQILLNNLLYDFAQVTIPTDRVDDDQIAKPRRWNIDFIRNFMVIFGPISSVFDILIFVVLLKVFNADEALFQTGWFLQSLATQTLVIHVIRSRHGFLESRASVPLTISTLAIVAIGLLIPYSGLAGFFGLVPLPPVVLGVIILITFSYLAVVGVVRGWFYRRFGG